MRSHDREAEMVVRYYPAVLERVSDGFSVFFPDLDGCVSAGGTAEQAAAHAEATLALHLGAMVKDGDPIPEPTPLERLEADPEVAEFARTLVRANLPGRAVRINITMDEGLLSAADAAAQRQGMSRSAFLADAVRNVLRAERVA
jgi:predicted RNase H-like HicB family nuclease